MNQLENIGLLIAYLELIRDLPRAHQPIVLDAITSRLGALSELPVPEHWSEGQDPAIVFDKVGAFANNVTNGDAQKALIIFRKLYPWIAVAYEHENVRRNTESLRAGLKNSEPLKL